MEKNWYITILHTKQSVNIKDTHCCNTPTTYCYQLIIPTSMEFSLYLLAPHIIKIHVSLSLNWQVCFKLLNIHYSTDFFYCSVIYNVMLVSSVKQSNSVTYTHIYILLQILFYYRLLQDIEYCSLCNIIDPACYLFYIQ